MGRVWRGPRVREGSLATPGHLLGHCDLVRHGDDQPRGCARVSDVHGLEVSDQVCELAQREVNADLL